MMEEKKTTKKLAIIYILTAMVIALVIPHMFDILMNECSCNKHRQSQNGSATANLKIGGFFGGGTSSEDSSKNGKNSNTDTSYAVNGTGSSKSKEGENVDSNEKFKSTTRDTVVVTYATSTIEEEMMMTTTLVTNIPTVSTQKYYPFLPPASILNRSWTIEGGKCYPKLDMLEQVIVNPHTFPFIISNFKKCSEYPDLLYIIAVHSSPENSALRMEIRNTWGSPSLYNKTKHITIFFMGISSVASVNQALQEENRLYKDLVVQNFRDIYDNLSHKAMMWLQWCSERCQNVQYFVKVEELTIVNVFSLTKLLGDISKNQENGFKEKLICKLWTKMPVLRDPSKDWHIPKSEYIDDIYPDYCSGLGYIVGKDLLNLLHNSSYYVPYFKVEDVYVTGILKKYLSAQTFNIWRQYAFKDEDFGRVLSGQSIFGFLEMKPGARFTAWNSIKSQDVG